MDAKHDALAILRADYARSCRMRTDVMAVLLARLEARPADRVALESLCHHFHGLAGAGASFGFVQVSDLGHRGECSALACLEHGLPTCAEDRAHWSHLLAAVREATALSV